MDTGFTETRAEASWQSGFLTGDGTRRAVGGGGIPAEAQVKEAGEWARRLKYVSQMKMEKSKQHADAVSCVDLFCGVGGLTHGLIAADVPVVAGVDLDEACRHPYEANNRGATFYVRDVAKLKAAEVQSWFGQASIRVLAGCAPCQPFSTYAQRYEPARKSWALLNHFARLVREIKPDVVTMENVPTVIKHKVFDNFVATLRSQNYEVWFDVVDSADYGLPQRRRRTVLLASLHGSIQLRAPDSSASKTVRDVLRDIPPLRHGGSNKNDPLHTASTLSATNLERIKASKPGGSWRDWPPHLVAECHKRKTGQTYPSVYGRMEWDEPAPTLTTQFYGFGNGRFGHPTQHRGLSLREGAILQGFPKAYSFVPDEGPIHFKILGRLIGNAVPVELGRAIGESIMTHVKQIGQHASSNRGSSRNGRKHTSDAILS